MEPRALKNLDSTHRLYGDGIIPTADGLLLVYNYWFQLLMLVLVRFQAAENLPEVGFVTAIAPKRAIVCVFLWCRCRCPLKLCTKGAEDDPDTGGKRRAEQEEGPVQQEENHQMILFLKSELLSELVKVIVYWSPFYHNYRQDTTFNHKSKRTTLAVAKLHSIGARVCRTMGGWVSAGGW